MYNKAFLAFIQGQRHIQLFVPVWSKWYDCLAPTFPDVWGSVVESFRWGIVLNQRTTKRWREIVLAASALIPVSIAIPISDRYMVSNPG